jgi:hypothetical protein
MGVTVVPHIALGLRVIGTESPNAVGDRVLVIEPRLVVGLLWLLIVHGRLIVRAWCKDRTAENSPDNAADDTPGKPTAATTMMAVLCLRRDARG